MEVLNYNEFRKNLTKNLNKISDEEGVVMVSGSKGKKVIVKALETYNAIQETLHITKSATNHKGWMRLLLKWKRVYSKSIQYQKK